VLCTVLLQCIVLLLLVVLHTDVSHDRGVTTFDNTVELVVLILKCCDK